MDASRLSMTAADRRFFREILASVTFEDRQTLAAEEQEYLKKNPPQKHQHNTNNRPNAAAGTSSFKYVDATANNRTTRGNNNNGNNNNQYGENVNGDGSAFSSASQAVTNKNNQHRQQPASSSSGAHHRSGGVGAVLSPFRTAAQRLSSVTGVGGIGGAHSPSHAAAADDDEDHHPAFEEEEEARRAFEEQQRKEKEEADAKKKGPNSATRMIIRCMKLALNTALENISDRAKDRKLVADRDFDAKSRIVFKYATDSSNLPPTMTAMTGKKSFYRPRRLKEAASSAMCCSGSAVRKTVLDSDSEEGTTDGSDSDEGSPQQMPGVGETRRNDFSDPPVHPRYNGRINSAVGGGGGTSSSARLGGDGGGKDNKNDDDDDDEASKVSSFGFTAYSPMCYRHIRDFFGVNSEDFKAVLCNSGWHSIPTPGKSAAQLFFCGQNWVIKTTNDEESRFLRRILHRYYDHVRDNRFTLLPRFMGHYRLNIPGQEQITFVIMQNVFATPNKINEKFDLKGSTIGRFSSKVEKTQATRTKKDLDINRPIHLGAARRELLIDQIKADCNFLRMSDIMDYSLLVGIHHIPDGQVVDESSLGFLPLSAMPSAGVGVGAPNGGVQFHQVNPNALSGDLAAAAFTPPRGGGGVPSASVAFGSTAAMSNPINNMVHHAAANSGVGVGAGGGGGDSPPWGYGGCSGGPSPTMPLPAASVGMLNAAGPARHQRQFSNGTAGSNSLNGGGSGGGGGGGNRQQHNSPNMGFHQPMMHGNANNNNAAASSFVGAPSFNAVVGGAVVSSMRVPVGVSPFANNANHNSNAMQHHSKMNNHHHNPHHHHHANHYDASYRGGVGGLVEPSSALFPAMAAGSGGGANNNTLLNTSKHSSGDRTLAGAAGDSAPPSFPHVSSGGGSSPNHNTASTLLVHRTYSSNNNNNAESANASGSAALRGLGGGRQSIPQSTLLGNGGLNGGGGGGAFYLDAASFNFGTYGAGSTNNMATAAASSRSFASNGVQRNSNNAMMMLAQQQQHQQMDLQQHQQQLLLYNQRLQQRTNNNNPAAAAAAAGAIHLPDTIVGDEAFGCISGFDKSCFTAFQGGMLNERPKKSIYNTTSLSAAGGKAGGGGAKGSGGNGAVSGGDSDSDDMPSFLGDGTVNGAGGAAMATGGGAGAAVVGSGEAASPPGVPAEFDNSNHFANNHNMPLLQGVGLEGILGANSAGFSLLPNDDQTKGREVYYIGIIDILQEYNARKTAETYLKSLTNERAKVSSVPAKEYAARFISFMSSVVV